MTSTEGKRKDGAIVGNYGYVRHREWTDDASQ